MGCIFATVLPVWGQDYLNDLFVNVTSQRNQLQLLPTTPKHVNICMSNTRTFNLVLPILMIYNKDLKEKK